MKLLTSSIAILASWFEIPLQLGCFDLSTQQVSVSVLECQLMEFVVVTVVGLTVVDAFYK